MTEPTSPILPPPVIELRGVTQRFGGQSVLRDLTISVRERETLVIVGESGCGKSVTVKLMMALLRPTLGEVFWHGRPVHNLSETAVTRERLRFGFLFQGAALFDSMTVYENIAFALRHNTRFEESRIRSIVLDRLQEVGLRNISCDAKPADLSGGMRKRVALARALALGPEVIVYDEPTTGLDPVMSDVINELILRTGARGVTGVVVTHDMRTVKRVADRVIMLQPLARLDPEAPQLVFQGTAEEIFASRDPRVDHFVHGLAGAQIEEFAVHRRLVHPALIDRLKKP